MFDLTMHPRDAMVPIAVYTYTSAIGPAYAPDFHIVVKQCRLPLRIGLTSIMSMIVEVEHQPQAVRDDLSNKS